MFRNGNFSGTTKSLLAKIGAALTYNEEIVFEGNPPSIHQWEGHFESLSNIQFTPSQDWVVHFRGNRVDHLDRCIVHIVSEGQVCKGMVEGWDCDIVFLHFVHLPRLSASVAYFSQKKKPEHLKRWSSPPVISTASHPE
ncbi:hypothetical protein IFM89_021807 [Coptis chinensis]|uniref:Uncharacterized protein n=1 Tax=Coptis chinensis TaxID=261450 RepID=A0A835M6I0_9MAGN|nr:hypothetical protein IFM89_021807 [Coptis chinensis]